MPDVTIKKFSGAGDARLPSNVKPLSLEKRRQWVGAWNGRFDDCKDDGGANDSCETSAFRVANAAIKKDMLEEELTDFAKDMTEAETSKFYSGVVESWDLWSRVLDQDEAEYNDRGGTDAEACSNCRWFVAPGACVIVEGYPLPIVSGGWSNRWEARKDATVNPIPVTIVDGEASLKERVTKLLDWLQSAWPGDNNAKTASAAALRDPWPSTNGFKLLKDKSGDTRWVAWMSNKFRDRDNPSEIISEEAHRDYVAWVDKTKEFPEAWLWHTLGSKWGQADWIDYAEGFVVVSGTVDKGMEHVAEAMEGEDLSVSHGFHYRHSDSKQGIIGWYRTFELSPLPPDVAANEWTAFDVISKEFDMPFSAPKREFLVGHLGEDHVAKLEGDTSKMREALEKKGVEWKALEEVPDEPPDDTKDLPTAVLSDEQMKDLGDAMGKAAADALVASDAFKGLVTATEGATDAIKGIVLRLDELELTDDEKIAKAFTARKGVPNGHVASADGNNVIAKDDPNYDPAMEGPTVLDNIMKQIEEPVAAE